MEAVAPGRLLPWEAPQAGGAREAQVLLYSLWARQVSLLLRVAAA